jgi:hypothetical protein
METKCLLCVHPNSDNADPDLQNDLSDAADPK